MSSIFYSNKTDFEKIIQNIKENGAEKLHFLADFDRTLTKSFIDGEARPSLIGAMRQGGYLGEEYTKEAYRLFDEYHPIEVNPIIPLEEKKVKMSQWWNKHLELLINSKLNKKHIDEVINSGILELREGVGEFIVFLEQKDVPLVIISANGLGGDSIKLYLEAKNFMRKNIFIVSNEFIWDSNGYATGYKKPVIHVFSKDETVLKDFPEINSKVERRKNVILLGDSLGDHHMVEGFEYDNLLKIGFLNENEEELLEEYKKRYDVVLTGDPDFSFVNNLIKEICQK
ncbi:MAG: hypothetical protein PHH06_02960 [Candidatus Gracilibacteria bacterium]|nr:hypothetical protein [Candidatus Gracilibacteria bacterium]